MGICIIFFLLKEQYSCLVKVILDFKAEISTRDDIINGLMARVEQLEIKTHETLRTESQLPEHFESMPDMVAGTFAQPLPPQPKGRGKAKVGKQAGVGENPTLQGALPIAKKVEPATSIPHAESNSSRQTVQRPRRKRTRGNQAGDGTPSPSQRQPIVHEMGICTNCRNANRDANHDFRLFEFNLNRKLNQLIWAVKKIHYLPSSPCLRQPGHTFLCETASAQGSK